MSQTEILAGHRATYRRVPIADVFEDQANSRKHGEENLAAIRGSIRQFGQVEPLVVQRSTGKVIGGNGRLRTMKELGHTEVDIAEVDIDNAGATALGIALNRTAELAEWDTEVLDRLTKELSTDDSDLDAMFSDMREEMFPAEQPEIVEDEVPAPPVEPITKPGDLWLLGPHKILCGDSTKREDVERVMGGERAVLLCTDPPYGVDFSGAKYNPRAKQWDGIANDTRKGDDLKTWLTEILKLWLEFCDDDLAVYLWTAAMQEGAAAAAAAAAAGIHIQSQIIWNKNCLVLGQADYQWKHENCWYGFIKGRHHRWFGGRSQTTVWDERKVANNDYEHPMQKPVALYARAIENHTHKGEIVAEPFAGSGTQIIAAEQTQRRCRAIEIEPKYVDVACARWAKLTGEKAILETA